MLKEYTQMRNLYPKGGTFFKVAVLLELIGKFLSRSPIMDNEPGPSRAITLSTFVIVKDPRGAAW
jgi:hypothetical protein